MAIALRLLENLAVRGWPEVPSAIVLAPSVPAITSCSPETVFTRITWPPLVVTIISPYGSKAMLIGLLPEKL